MRKLILLLITIITFSGTGLLNAQTFTFNPGEVVTEYVELEHYKNIQVYMAHPDYDDITLGWVPVEVNMLQKWEYSSCDNGGCYGYLPDSAQIGPLPDTIPGYIRITVNPRDQLGTSTVKIYVYNVKFPDDGKIVTFEIIATGLTAIDDVDAEIFNIYPNPASELITVNNSSGVKSSFQFVDLTGKTMFEDLMNPEERKSFNISDFPKGIYFARFQNENTYRTRKIIIQ